MKLVKLETFTTPFVSFVRATSETGATGWGQSCAGLHIWRGFGAATTGRVRRTWPPIRALPSACAKPVGAMLNWCLQH